LAPEEPTYIRLKLSASKLKRYFDLTGEIADDVASRKPHHLGEVLFLVGCEDEFHWAVRKFRSLLQNIEHQRESNGVQGPSVDFSATRNLS
jgi:hypothetical protein